MSDLSTNRPDNRPEIRILPDHVVDQIAAGEVIERPASVVKELTENALDAGATHVSVEVEQGGKRLIRVLDNGLGMTEEEARLALTRHATSKLRSLDDLYGIDTMGFRGEALSSIAAVSRMSITTRTRGRVAGTRLDIEAGRIVSVSEVGAPVGTHIEVRDLLFNVPARLKFLKGNATEASHITDAVSRLAMVHPDVHIRLRHGGRISIDAPQHPSGLERARAILGSRLGRTLHGVRATENGIWVEACLAGPDLAQSTSRSTYLFVGRRPVKDRGLLHALTMGYGELIPKGRFPVAVVRVEVPGDDVDVNVHPQKLEVRFSDPQLVYAAVRHTVRRGVAEAPWLSEEASGSPVRMRAIAAVAPPRGAARETQGASRVAASQAAEASRLLLPFGRAAGDRDDGARVSAGRAITAERAAEPDAAVGGGTDAGAGAGTDAGISTVRTNTAALDAGPNAGRGAGLAGARDAGGDADAAGDPRRVWDAARARALRSSPSPSRDDGHSLPAARFPLAPAVPDEDLDQADGDNNDLDSASGWRSARDRAIHSARATGAPSGASRAAQPTPGWSGVRGIGEPPRVPSSRPAPGERADAPVGAHSVPAPDGDAARFFSNLRYIGQLDRTYLICEAGEEMVLVDQHAAHERVAFQRLRERYQKRDVPVQRILFPKTIELSGAHAAMISETQDALSAMGFELEPFGGNSFAVKAVPAGLSESEIKDVLTELLDDLLEHGGTRALEERLDLALATIACHSVVRAGDALSPQEVRALFESMDQVDFKAHCPHGRPVLLRISVSEIARRFGRT